MQLTAEEALLNEKFKELSMKSSGRSGGEGYRRLVTKMSFHL